MFTYELKLQDGTTLQPFTTATPTWAAGDEVTLTPTNRYRVLAVEPHPTLNGTLSVEPIQR